MPASDDSWQQWWKTLYHEELDLPPLPMKRKPFDEDAFQAAWSRAVADVVTGMSHAGFVVQDALLHPQLGALEGLCRNAWDDLEDEPVFGQALAIIAKMDDQPMAAIVGFEQFHAALVLGGDRTRCQTVADRYQKYLRENPTTADYFQKVRNATYPIERPRLKDFIPEDDG